MWLTNGATSSLVALLARTAEGAGQPHRNLTAFLIEKAPGFGATRPGLTRLRAGGDVRAKSPYVRENYRRAPGDQLQACRDGDQSNSRHHGGCGYSTEHEIERLYRDAPMLLIGEGTAEIQKMIIGRCLVRDYPAGS